jgi:hypothetical protein
MQEPYRSTFAKFLSDSQNGFGGNLLDHFASVFIDNPSHGFAARSVEVKGQLVVFAKHPGCIDRMHSLNQLTLFLLVRGADGFRGGRG